MDNKTNRVEKFNGFLEGKGFYIILAVCLCAIGVSGYVLFFTEADAPEYQVELPKNNSSGQVTAVNPVPDIKVDVEKPKEATKEQPVAKVETPAAKEPETPKETIYVPPVVGKVSRTFSGGELVFDETMGDYRTHNGVDIECQAGTQVAAISDGKVEKVYSDELSGNCVVISHSDGVKSIYKGLAKESTLKTGARIKAGDIVGASGETNITEAKQTAHFHLEVTKDGQYIDPFSIIK